jgi:hypothetical protein
MRGDLKTAVISQFHSICHILRVNTTPKKFIIIISRWDWKKRGINEQLSPSKSEKQKKAFRQRYWQRINDNELKKKVPLALASLRVLTTSCLKYRISARRLGCHEEYVVQIDVWTVILKNEGKK